MDKRLICSIENALQQLHDRDMRLERTANILLIFEENYRPIFLKYTDSSVCEIIRLKSSLNLKGVEDFNIRRHMDREIISEVSRKGFVYREDLSDNYSIRRVSKLFN